MNVMTYIVVGVFVFGLLITVFILAVNDLLYERQAIMTPGELRFFKILKTIISPAMTVFPQVRLASVVKPKDPFKWKNFAPLAIRSLDFVITDFESGSTLLVIELDDKSHSLIKRQFRDKFIDRVLRSANIPILHIPYQKYYDHRALKILIENATGLAS